MEIACGELRWEGARQHAGRRGNRAKRLWTLAPARSETAFKPWKWLGESSMQSCWCGFSELLAPFFRTYVIIAIVLKNCGPKTGQMVPRPVKRFPKAEKWDMHGKTFVAGRGFVLQKPWTKVVGRG